jgi:hypothetical protein
MSDFQRSYYMPTGEKYADITVKDGVASISERACCTLSSSGTG